MADFAEVGGFTMDRLKRTRDNTSAKQSIGSASHSCPVCRLAANAQHLRVENVSAWSMCNERGSQHLVHLGSHRIPFFRSV